MTGAILNAGSVMQRSECAAASPATPGAPRSPQEPPGAGRGKELPSIFSPSEGHDPVNTVISALWPPEL